MGEGERLNGRSGEKRREVKRDNKGKIEEGVRGGERGGEGRVWAVFKPVVP